MWQQEGGRSSQEPRVVVIVSNPTAGNPTRRRKGFARGGLTPPDATSQATSTVDTTPHTITPQPKRGQPSKALPSPLPVGRRIPLCQPWVRHDPIDYLQFRRTMESVQVVRRSRHLALKQTDLQRPLRHATPTTHPSSSSKPSTFCITDRSDRFSALRQLQHPMVRSEKSQRRWDQPFLPHHVSPLSITRSIQPPPKSQPPTRLVVTSAMLKAKHVALTAIATQHSIVTATLVAIRETLAVTVVTTPLFKRWRRIQWQAAWDRWTCHTVSQRVERTRLTSLTTFAIPIQRAFRQRLAHRRTRRTRQRGHLTVLTGAVMLQRWSRRTLRRYNGAYIARSEQAVVCQARWRGRQARANVKTKCRETLRCLLQRLCPLGRLSQLPTLSWEDYTVSPYKPLHLPSSRHPRSKTNATSKSNAIFNANANRPLKKKSRGFSYQVYLLTKSPELLIPQALMAAMDDATSDTLPVAPKETRLEGLTLTRTLATTCADLRRLIAALTHVVLTREASTRVFKQSALLTRQHRHNVLVHRRKTQEHTRRLAHTERQARQVACKSMAIMDRESRQQAREWACAAALFTFRRRRRRERQEAAERGVMKKEDHATRHVWWSLAQSAATLATQRQVLTVQHQLLTRETEHAITCVALWDQELVDETTRAIVAKRAAALQRRDDWRLLTQQQALEQAAHQAMQHQEVETRRVRQQVAEEAAATQRLADHDHMEVLRYQRHCGALDRSREAAARRAMATHEGQWVHLARKRASDDAWRRHRARQDTAPATSLADKPQEVQRNDTQEKNENEEDGLKDSFELALSKLRTQDKAIERTRQARMTMTQEDQRCHVVEAALRHQRALQIADAKMRAARREARARDTMARNEAETHVVWQHLRSDALQAATLRGMQGVAAERRDRLAEAKARHAMFAQEMALKKCRDHLRRRDARIALLTRDAMALEEHAMHLVNASLARRAERRRERQSRAHMSREDVRSRTVMTLEARGETLLAQVWTAAERAVLRSCDAYPLYLRQTLAALAIQCFTPSHETAQTITYRLKVEAMLTTLVFPPRVDRSLVMEVGAINFFPEMAVGKDPSPDPSSTEGLDRFPLVTTSVTTPVMYWHPVYGRGVVLAFLGHPNDLPRKEDRDKEKEKTCVVTLQFDATHYGAWMFPYDSMAQCPVTSLSEEATSSSTETTFLPTLTTPKTPKTPTQTLRDKWFKAFRILVSHAQRHRQRQLERATVLSTSSITLFTAIAILQHMLDQSTSLSTSASSASATTLKLSRTLGQWYLKAYHLCLEPYYLQRASTYYRYAATRIELLVSPSFLNELANVSTAFAHSTLAATLQGKLITAFPSYPRLKQVIFQAGLSLLHVAYVDTTPSFSLARKYLSYALDDPPEPWNEDDLLFLLARVSEREKDLSMAAAGYKQAYRGYLRTDRGPSREELTPIRFTSWKTWCASPHIWFTVGQRYYTQGLYDLARDALEVAQRKQQRCQSRTSRHRPPSSSSATTLTATTVHLLGPSEVEVLQWTLAICYARGKDPHRCQEMMERDVFPTQSYQARVMDRMKAWPSTKWVALGLTPPPVKEVEEEEVEVVERPDGG